MSYGTAMDYADDQDGGELEPNAHCHDCGAAYSRAEDDPGVWCDGCSDRRDAHTSALEQRLGSATALAAVDPAGGSERRPSTRVTIFDRLPTLSAVAASRAHKPIPKKQQSSQRRKSA
jgi:hypothetical protein